MLLLMVLFAGIPVSYLWIHGGDSVLVAMYAITIGALGLGYIVSRIISTNKVKFPGAPARIWNFRLLERMLQIMLGLMLVSMLVAIKSIATLGADYRLLFFLEQKSIFGFERYGFFLQLLAEYGGIVIFSVLLVNSKEKKWRRYLLAWVAMGTVITLGRWFILYGILLLYLTEDQGATKSKFKNRVFFLLLTLLVTVGGALIFMCRGESCEMEPSAIGQGVIFGIVNYFYIPLEMISEYQSERGFGTNLLLGFSVYPIHFIGKITGLYALPYEYDSWALQIQGYVSLENIGMYNALVGQPLTSLVAAGYAGIFLHYFVGGLLVGTSNKFTSKYSALQVLSIIVLATSFLIPTLSGPMFVVCLLWYAILLSACRRSKNISTDCAITT
jgi:hypothetical protein